MVRATGMVLMLFALLGLIVHQVGMFEFLGALGATLLTIDVVHARSSKSRRVMTSLRDPLL